MAIRIFSGSESPLERFVSEVVKMMKASEAKLLPILKAGGVEHIVDIQRREFREFKNPANVINMHSKLGRKIAKESKQWHSFGLDKPPEKSSYDIIVCGRCANSMAANM